MLNRAICAARAAWYGAYESRQLRRRREKYEGKYLETFSGPFLKGGGSVVDVRLEKRPLVSVLIPTHNRVELLVTRALPSVLAQTYTNLEIIVAAHGCTDDTESYVRGLTSIDPWPGVFGLTKEILGKYDPRVRLLTVPRKCTYPPTAENHWLAGPVAPLNAALKAATGAWVSRVDDDDVLAPNHIESLLRFAQEGDYEFVSSAYETERDGERGIVWPDGQEPPIGGTQTWLWRSYLKFMRYNPDCWRKTWNRVNDTDLADRFRKAGVRIGWTPEVTARVLPRPGETTVGLAAYRRDTEATEAAFAFRT